jgi:hypothetical protein
MANKIAVVDPAHVRNGQTRSAVANINRLLSQLWRSHMANDDSPGLVIKSRFLDRRSVRQNVVKLFSDQGWTVTPELITYGGEENGKPIKNTAGQVRPLFNVWWLRFQLES